LVESIRIGDVFIDGPIGDAGVVDQDVDPAPELLGKLHDRFALGDESDIQGIDPYPFVFSNPSGGKAMQGGFAGGEEEPIRSLDEEFGQGEAQPGAGASE
jgi:hypothetical protein